MAVVGVDDVDLVALLRVDAQDEAARLALHLGDLRARRQGEGARGLRRSMPAQLRHDADRHEGQGDDNQRSKPYDNGLEHAPTRGVGGCSGRDV